MKLSTCRFSQSAEFAHQTVAQRAADGICGEQAAADDQVRGAGRGIRHGIILPCPVEVEESKRELPAAPAIARTQAAMWQPCECVRLAGNVFDGDTALRNSV